MQVLIGNKNDCIEEIVETFKDYQGKNILLDYSFYQKMLDGIEVDFSKTNVFFLENEMPSKEFVEHNSLKTYFLPSMEGYYENLLFHPIDLAFIGIKKEGSIGSNDPSNTNFENFKNENGLGLKGIMNAKEILVYLWGDEMSERANDFLTSELTEKYPASILINHENSRLLLDKKASQKLDKESEPGL